MLRHKDVVELAGRHYYTPSENGNEKALKERLEQLRAMPQEAATETEPPDPNKPKNKHGW